MSDRCQACGLGWLTNFLCLKFVRGLQAHRPSTQPFSRAWVALIRAWHETRVTLSDLQEGNSYELGGNQKEGPGTGKFFEKAAGLYVLLSTSSKNWEAPRCVFRARCCLSHCSNSPPRPSDTHLSLNIGSDPTGQIHAKPPAPDEMQKRQAILCSLRHARSK